MCCGGRGRHQLAISLKLSPRVCVFNLYQLPRYQQLQLLPAQDIFKLDFALIRERFIRRTNTRTVEVVIIILACFDLAAEWETDSVNTAEVLKYKMFVWPST